MYIEMDELNIVISDFITDNGLINHIFTSPTLENEVILSSRNNMKIFKHWLASTALNILVEWYYDLDKKLDLCDKDDVKELRCYWISKLQDFPTDMGYWN